MSDRRGFALLTVLWLVATLSAAVGLGLAATRLGFRTSSNRIVLTRARWAAEACLQIAAARWREHKLADTSTVDLGRRTRCSWRVTDPGSRINVNTAAPDLLERLFHNPRLARQVVAARPFESVEQAGASASLFTVDGPGTINLTSAPVPILLALPGMTAEAAERIVARRQIGRPIASLDELTGVVSSPARATLLQNYGELARIVTFAPTRLLVTAEGWLEGEAPRTVIELLCVPLPERLATVRRRMW